MSRKSINTLLRDEYITRIIGGSCFISKFHRHTHLYYNRLKFEKSNCRRLFYNNRFYGGEYDYNNNFKSLDRILIYLHIKVIYMLPKLFTFWLRVYTHNSKLLRLFAVQLKWKQSILNHNSMTPVILIKVHRHRK